MLKKQITIYDLARKLNVSTATVSRALHDDPLVSAKTRKSVQEFAKSMGYQRHAYASNLRSSRTNTIGVIVPKLNSPFIAAVLSGIEKVVAAAGLDVIVASSSEQFDKEVANANNLFHKRVDGIIASLASNTHTLDHFMQYSDKGIPVIFFDRVDEDGDHTKIVIDNHKCGYQATRHLAEQGCRKIMLVTGDPQCSVYGQRMNGYKEALHQCKLACQPEWMLVKEPGEQAGREIAQEIIAMEARPDGLFITHDHTAVVCMQALIAHGLNIPGDIAVVGFNDDEVSRIVRPGLTTIRYPGQEMGEVAARNLVDQLNGVNNQQAVSKIVMSSDLIIRGSSLKGGIDTKSYAVDKASLLASCF